MNTDDKLVAAAKRAARRLSRETGQSHQLCLDLVARRVGKSTWTGFLHDPVPVDEASIEAASEPDFSAMIGRDQARAIVRHGLRLEAVSFHARPRSREDGSAILSYVLADGREWPIDARGLSLPDLARNCLSARQWAEIPRFDHCLDLDTGTPTIADVMMRSSVRTMTDGNLMMFDITATLDGGTPVDNQFGHFEKERSPAGPTIPWQPPEYRPNLSTRLTEGISRFVRGTNGHTIERLLRIGSLTTDREGPIVAVTPRGTDIRLKHGHNLFAFSPVGTGRLAGLTVPALLSDDTASYVVHDDGQLHEITSGHRASIGDIAVIRLDGDTRDSINPFSREWLPERKYRDRYLDALAASLVDNDQKKARLILEKALVLIARNGETSLREIHDEIARTRDHPLSREVLMAIHPLVDTLGHAACGTSSIGPGILRDSRRTATIYIIRNPRTSQGTRKRLASLLQTAIWLHASIYTEPYRPLPGKRHLRQMSTIIHDYHAMAAIPILPMMADTSRNHGTSVILSGNTAASLEEKHPDEGWWVHRYAHVNMILTQSERSELALIDRGEELDWNEVCSLKQGQCILGTSGLSLHARFGLPFFFRRRDLIRRAWNPRSGKGPPPVG